MTSSDDDHFRDSLQAIERTLEKLQGCSSQEREHLRAEFAELQRMHEKLRGGTVEITVFGEISTGKSALINALSGTQTAGVNVQGGWTKTIDRTAWQGIGYALPGLSDSKVLLVDTPGLNEVGGSERGEAALEAARASDLLLFVSDSDLNEIEYSALVALAAVHKPIIFVLNKIDLYSREQQAQLIRILRDDRLRELIPSENFITVKADPREVERVVVAADGSETSSFVKPAPDVIALRSRILEVLEREGLALLALNGALFAADRSDRISALRVEYREKYAQKVIGGYAALKAVMVGLNPFPVADVLGGAAIDVAMVLTLAGVYGLELSWLNARALVTSILQSAGWTLAATTAMHYASSLFKALTVGWGTVITAVPQGAAAGYGTYIVGQAAKYYFEHGGSWGTEGPKEVVRRILAETDRDSVVRHLKDEIEKKLAWNRHARGERT